MLQEYIVDFSSNNNFFLVKGVQGDTERYVRLHLSNYGQPYTINTDDSVYATIRGTKPDNKEVWNYCTIIDSSTIEFQLTPQMLAVAGKSDYEISILRTDSNKVLTSFPFFIIVSKSAVDLDYIASSDEFTVLADRIYQSHVATEECISRTEDCVEATEDLRELEVEVSGNEKVRIDTENARKATEEQRIQNEKDRNNAENFRIANENDRLIIEALRVKAEQERCEVENDRVIEEENRKETEEQRRFSENLREIEEEKRIKHENIRILSENNRNASETERMTYEILRHDAEHDRKVAESQRVNAENIRVNSEEQREIYEYFRKENEQERIDAEQIRLANEINRIDMENSIKLSEILRTKSENERLENESIRINAENLRNETELERNISEELRKKEEAIRVETENTRIVSENLRIESENERIGSELLREQAEIDRQTNTATAISNAEQATINANTAADYANEAANNVINAIGIDDTQTSTLTTWSSDYINDYTNGTYMKQSNPTGTGRFSLNRKSGTTSGSYSFVEGYNCEASGKYSHAEGRATSAQGDYQHVQGVYNKLDSDYKYLHIVGNGTYDTTNQIYQRSNAHTLDWDGNAEFAGDVVAYGCGGEKPIKFSELSDEIKEFYVSPNGSDETGDGTEANPWNSIQKAIDASSRFSLNKIHIVEGSYYPTNKILIDSKKIDFVLYGEYVMLYDTEFESKSYMIHVCNNSILKIYSADLNSKTSFSIYSSENNITAGIYVEDYSYTTIGGLSSLSITGGSSTKFGITSHSNSNVNIYNNVDNVTIYAYIGMAAQINSSIMVATATSLRNTQPDTSITSYGIYSVFNSNVYISELNITGDNTDTALDGEILQYNFKYGLYANSGSEISYKSISENLSTNLYYANSGSHIYTGTPGKITHSTTGRYAIMVKDTNYYFRPDTQDKDMNLGSNNYRWNTVYCVTNNTSSDERLKENFDTNMEKYIAMIDLLEPTSYNFIFDSNNQNRKRNVGYIAQRVQDAMEQVGLDVKDFAGLDFNENEQEGEYSYGLVYSQFIPILHAKIKKQDKEIAELKELVNQLVGATAK